MLIDLKDSDFETKIKQEDVSIVQFSAAWCGPCKNLRPIMESFSETRKKENQNYYYADVEEDAINTASAAGIRGVPTVIIYKKGVEVNRLVGGVPEGKMAEFLDENI